MSASPAARPRASTSLWYTVRQPRRCSRIVVWMSSVIVSVATPSTSSSAATRTTAQLLLVGLILKWLFESAAPWWIGVMALVMLGVAGREVMARQHYRMRGSWGFVLGTASMFVSAFSVALIALVVIIGNEPWYTPQYAIPLLGMLLGNTMNGIALATSPILS